MYVIFKQRGRIIANSRIINDIISLTDFDKPKTKYSVIIV